MIIKVVEAQAGQIAPGLVCGLVGDTFYVQTRYPNGTPVPAKHIVATMRDLIDHARDNPDWTFAPSPALAGPLAEVFAPPSAT